MSLKMQLSKVLLITGIICLASSFYMFYWASRVDWEYVTRYQNTVQFHNSQRYQFAEVDSLSDLGKLYYQFLDGLAESWHIPMSPNDFITVSYEIPTNGTVYILLWNQNQSQELEGYPLITLTNSSLLYYPASEAISVMPEFVAENSNNVLTTLIVFHHYESPDWGRFAFGIVFASFAVVTVFESRRARLQITSRTEEESEERKT